MVSAQPTVEETEVARWLRQLLPRSGAQCWYPIDVEDVRLEGGFPETKLVVLLRLRERRQVLYGLHTKLSEWDFPGAGLPQPEAEGWAMWVVDAVMEAVEATPGLPAEHPNDSGIVWVDLDA